MQPIDFFIRASKLHGEQCAVHEVASNRKLSYLELLDQVNALASGFQGLTGKERPTVAILAGNSIEMLLGILATYATAGVFVPMTPTLVESDIARQLDSVTPDLVLFEPVYEDLLVSYQGLRISTGGASQEQSVEKLVSQYKGKVPVRVASVSLDEAVAVKFTGGSSGTPKAVLQSFRCINTMVASLLMVYGISDRERFLIGPPMTHGAGTFVLPVLASGACLLILNKPTARECFDALKTLQVTSTWLPPTLLYKLVEIQKAERACFASLENILYGGAPCTPSLIEDTISCFGPVLGATYGLTEAPVIMAGMSGAVGSLPENLGSAGRVGPLTRMAVLDAEGNICEVPNVLGEIIASGDLLMSGYMRMPEQTDAVLKGGWFRTGDIGLIDERGFVFIKGRSKDVVISGGFNVYPSDVEDAYSKHEGIAECVVFGVADEVWGERVEMAIVPVAGTAFTSAELIEFGKQKLGSIRTPKHIHVVAHFPKNALGKINKQLIVNELQGK